jgi:hypothetical protein
MNIYFGQNVYGHSCGQMKTNSGSYAFGLISWPDFI